MKNIYVVRHCQAEGQEADAGLTEHGRQQAEQLANFLLDKHIDYIISSPFERACCTIAPLADKIGVEMLLDVRLTERILSDKHDPDWRNMLRKTYDDLELTYEGGESSRMAMNRAIAVVMELLHREHRNIVLVSHGNLISLLLKHFDERIGFKEWEALSNPDIFQLSFSEDKPSMRRIWA